MKSLIGKKYIPIDNSWSVNVTECGDILRNAKSSYLAGTNVPYKEAKECTIVSEPFQCYTNTTGIKNSKRIRTMIMIDYQNETHMVLFNKNCINK